MSRTADASAWIVFAPALNLLSVDLRLRLVEQAAKLDPRDPMEEILIGRWLEAQARLHYDDATTEDPSKQPNYLKLDRHALAQLRFLDQRRARAERLAARPATPRRKAEPSAPEAKIPASPEIHQSQPEPTIPTPRPAQPEVETHPSPSDPSVRVIYQLHRPTPDPVAPVAPVAAPANGTPSGLSRLERACIIQGIPPLRRPDRSNPPPGPI